MRHPKKPKSQARWLNAPGAVHMLCPQGRLGVSLRASLGHLGNARWYVVHGRPGAGETIQ